MALRIENVSKKYVIGHAGGNRQRFSGDGLRHAVTDVLVSPFRALRRRFRTVVSASNLPHPTSELTILNSQLSTASPEDLWALRNVSFDVKRGEVLGIIGRNGAGKSTLLKILSRITDPTSGRVGIKGRVASLLEVGTGFHPELTGRENVFLNGAILGMSREEIRGKFDEIVDFSGVGRFLDTPVKRYSSGMYVRLAFAVAAHLEPEILIVDEVLAVGDAEFQRRCLGKMQDVSREGRTILFVSHNMAAVNNLCSRVVLLSNGSLVADGPSDAVISDYVKIGGTSLAEVTWEDAAGAPGSDRVHLRAVRVLSEGETTSDVPIDRECQIQIEYINLTENLALTASIHLLDRIGTEVLASANLPSANLGSDDWSQKPFPRGMFRSVCTFPANLLNEGRYSIRVALCSNISHVEFLTGEILSFDTHDGGEMRKEYVGGWLGVVRPKLTWQTEQIPVALPN